MKNLYPGLSLILLFFIGSFLCVTPSQAERLQQALVIGNSDYEIGALKNPYNDARDISKKLQETGFQVTELTNASQREMESAIRKFTNSLTKDTVSLFFFAGHGIEIDGENFLVPIGAEIINESDVKYEAVAVGRLLDGMKRSESNLNLIVLDACRNNPYSRSFRSATRGLTEMRPASGTLILYATEPGNIASDGTGKNGLFTEQLLKNMDLPGVTVEEAFKKTALAVNNLTQGKQKPWYEGIILGNFYFRPGQKSAPKDVPSSEFKGSKKYHSDFFEGKKITGKTLRDAFIEIEIKPDKVAYIKVEATNILVKNHSSEGNWFVDDQKYICMKFKKFNRGKMLCRYPVEKGDKVILLPRDNDPDKPHWELH